MSIYLIDLTLNIAERVGYKAVTHLFRKMSDWPYTKAEGDTFIKGTHQSLISDLHNTESLYQESLSLALELGNVDLHEVLNRYRARIEKLRHTIDSTSIDVNVSGVTQVDFQKALIMLYLTIEYELYGIKYVSNNLYNYF